MSRVIETLLDKIKNIDDYEIRFNSLISQSMICRKCKINVTDVSKIGDIYQLHDSICLGIQCTKCECLYRCNCGSVIWNGNKHNKKNHFKSINIKTF